MALCCSYCSIPLFEPFIKCAQCSEMSSSVTVYLCLNCFASGRETSNHKSDHSYEVIRDDLPVFTKHWTAAEENRLLNGINIAGYGNWSEVSNYVATKSYRQCRDHYMRFYIDNPHPSLPEMKMPDVDFFHCPLPFRDAASVGQEDSCGYCAPRGDFNIEYNDHVELDISDINFSDCTDPLEYDLQMASIRFYRNVLKERRRRKMIVKRYGLINLPNNAVHGVHCEPILGNRAMKSLRTLSQLVTPYQWDLCLEGLAYEIKLQQRVLMLKKYRSNGIKTFHASRMFDHLSKRRKETESERHLLHDIINFVKEDARCDTSQLWNQHKTVVETLRAGLGDKKIVQYRKKAPPKDYSAFPGFERLSGPEKELCSTLRISPETYLNFRRLLVDSYTTHGQVKLATARTICKIDVNKTRKIFDLLVHERLINISSDRESTGCL